MEGLLEEFAGQPPAEYTDDDEADDVVRVVPLDQIGAKVVRVQFG